MVIRGAERPLKDNKTKKEEIPMKKLVALFLAMVMVLSMASIAVA